jgi:parallel beta-helix repeat protein
MPSVFIIALIALLSGVVDLGHCATYHVDASHGNDGYPGTEKEPFRTIRRASEVMTPGDKALIHEGVYQEQIMGGKSGAEGAPIVYEGVDRERVILRGCVRVSDWKKVGNVWMKGAVRPITPVNAYVMVDEQRKLTRVGSPMDMPEGSFYLGPEGVYAIRLWGDKNPNTDHAIDVHKLDFAFNAGDRWGGTSKKWIVLRNMTIEKYGVYAVSTLPSQHAENSHWELDGLIIRYNNGAGVFSCLDDWHVHDCVFERNGIHGCQIDGARVRFERNTCKENEWFAHSGYGGAGVLVGPNAWTHSCIIRHNTFLNDGYPDGYGCGIYLEGKSSGNIIEGNVIRGSRHAGVGFYGSSKNIVINNVLIDISPKNLWELTAAFVVHHSLEGPPTQSKGNLIAHNTVWGCAAPVAATDPSEPMGAQDVNRFVNNFFGLCKACLALTASPVAQFENNAWYRCPESSPPGEMRRWFGAFSGAGSKFSGTPPDSAPVVVTNPDFVNPDSSDFHLRKGSPLIDAGSPLPAVKTDKDGNPRPAGAKPDIGAYEFLGAP